MTIRTYEYGSADYEAAVALRRRILRSPLGLVFTDADLALDVHDILIGAFDEDGNMTGTLNLVPEGDDVKMRQVLVDTAHQGHGIGSEMVEFSERIARLRGFERMVLHARETAVHFYERLGYRVVGEVFTEVTVPHRAMFKPLRNE